MKNFSVMPHYGHALGISRTLGMCCSQQWVCFGKAQQDVYKNGCH